MDLALLQTLVAVVEEGSFSGAGQKLLRTQPAISLALQRLEADLGEKLVDRSSKNLVLTDAGRVVLEYARRFDGLEQELRNALVELRDKQAGKLTIGANESTALYLLVHIEAYRKLYPGVKVEIRRSLSSRIPEAVLNGSLDLGAVSYAPRDPSLVAKEIYNDRLTFIVSPKHRFAGREKLSISELGMETFIAHNVVSPYRQQVIDTFRRLKVPLKMEIEMPTIETIRKLVQLNMGVAFLPKMCVEQEIAAGVLKEVPVEEMQMERKIRLVHAAKRQLSHAAQAFLEVVGRGGEVESQPA
jgi:DNA-binding transcriptional LysR family regulator